ncbi:MAG: hypothetical protein ACPGO3_04685 [Magnetospiraceae bacterium]
MIEAFDRRALLETAPNPERSLDYLVSVAGQLGEIGIVAFWYVPDKLILAPGALGAYLQEIGGIAPESLETAAAQLFNDLVNELVPRWSRLVLSASQHTEPVTGHQVTFEERQPKWDNAPLLAALSAPV